MMDTKIEYINSSFNFRIPAGNKGMIEKIGVIPMLINGRTLIT